MIDWQNTLVDAEYRRSALLEEARRDTLAEESISLNGAMPDDAGRANVLGVLVAALVTIVVTGALAPR